MSRAYHVDGSQPVFDEIFVFGSNLSGIHGAGAAKAANQFYGAAWGIGEGLTGRSYALPTVQKNIGGSLPLADIKVYVERFITFAHHNPETKFFVTRVGCVLAGYSDTEIAPLFRDAPPNCSLPETWRAFVQS